MKRFFQPTIKSYQAFSFKLNFMTLQVKLNPLYHLPSIPSPTLSEERYPLSPLWVSFQIFFCMRTCVYRPTDNMSCVFLT